MGRRNAESSVLGGPDDVSIGNGRRGTGMTIDHLIARLHGAIRTYQHFQTIRDITCTEITDILRINSIGETELLTRSNMRGSNTCECLCHSRCYGYYHT